MDAITIYFSYIQCMLQAISLTDHVPLISACSNDTVYEHIFAEQLATMIEPGDVAIGMSTSDNSLHVIKALLLTKQLDGMAIGLLGGGRGHDQR